MDEFAEFVVMVIGIIITLAFWAAAIAAASYIFRLVVLN